MTFPDPGIVPARRTRIRPLMPQSAPAETAAKMFYFFTRDGISLRCEVRADLDGDGYELVIEQPDGRILVERFAESAALNRRWTTLEQSLRRDGWVGPHAPDA